MMNIVEPVEEYLDRYEVGAMAGATKAVSGIRGAFVIAHGVQGCTATANHLRSGGPVVAEDSEHIMPFVSTGVGMVESVHGRNIDLILRWGRRLTKPLGKKAELGFIFTGCCGSIIEDDTGRAAALLSEEIGAPVIDIDTAGFIGGFNRGAELTWCAVLDKFCTNSQEKRGINLVGPQLMGSKNWPNDLREIKRLLKAADIELNQVLFQDISVGQLPEISRAKANYLLCGEDFSQFEEKSEDLGMECWGQDLVLPIGIHNTEEWYLTIAQKFGNPDKAKSQLKEDMDRIKKILRFNYNATWALSALATKRVSILGYAPFAAAMARFLFYDLNMRPVVIGLLGETPDSIERAEKLLEPMNEFLDFEVLENPVYLAYGEKIKEAKVDFNIGMQPEVQFIEDLGIPHCCLGGFYFYSQWNFVPWPYFGILGVLNLLSELWNAESRSIFGIGRLERRPYFPRDHPAEKNK